ncbi:hypothetical protein QOZ80_2BG0172800 [Eleusine coracana subsp. coracana]|nr:hypothetical protein QOZ80_2BG0172800 [Eleusine coracana subsp. coracana]
MSTRSVCPPRPSSRATMDVPHRRERDLEAAPKRRKISSGDRAAPSKDIKLSHRRALAELPTEIVLEIVDRCDPATLIVCAATCRLLHRHILNPAFIAKLQHAASSRRFASSSLLGLFYRHYKGQPSSSRPPSFTPMMSTPGIVVRSPFDPDVFDSYTPVESRGGLLVLRDSALFTEHANICIYDTITGKRTIVPPPEVHQQSYALLLSPDNDTTFLRLIVVDLSLFAQHHTVPAQILSPDVGGAWGPIIEALTSNGLNLRNDVMVARPSTLIIGGMLHWLCTDKRTILTFDSDTAELRRAVDMEKMLTVPAELFLPPYQYLLSHNIVQLQWVGEMSRAVVAQVAGVGLLVLDMDTEAVVCKVQSRNRNNMDVNGLPFRYCPYERDLVARLAAMYVSYVKPATLSLP